jgi:DNA-binding response OmpR family regulator
MSEKRILAIDDEDDLRSITRELLEGEGYEVIEAQDGQKASTILQESWQDIDLFLLDLRLPFIDGERLIQMICRYQDNPKIIVVSAHLDSQTRDLLNTYRVHNYLKKPFNIQELLQSVKAALQ